MNSRFARSSNEPGGIGMMRARPSHLSGLALRLGAMLAVTFFTACGDGTTEPPPDPPRATTITVSPATAELAVPGSTVRLTVQVLDENGQPMTGVEIVWAVDDTAVAVVDASGLVTGIVDGTATVTATVGGMTGAATVMVAMGSVATDRTALVALYNATDGPNWWDNENWLTDAPLNEWHGVTTDSVGRVVRLGLTRNRLTGEIPTELSGLASLESLSLYANQLTGAIPPELGDLVNLEWLSVYGNDLSGAIPPELGNLINLEWLDLNQNNLSGAIPPELGNLANLQTLSLSRNDLSGAIPPELGNLVNLEWRLSVYGNDLSGAIPPELGNLINLERLDLSRNDLSGEIPAELGGLASLKSLSLYANQLTGAMPPELGDLTNLGWLTVYENALSGAIPPTLLTLRLYRFYWYSNSGLCAPGTSVFVEWLGSSGRGPYCNASDQAVLTSLYQLAVGDDWTESLGWLGGPALEEWHGVETDSLGRVTALALSDNGLSGGLPKAIGNLGQLTRLRIDDNELGGRLPLSLSRLDLVEFHYDGTDLCEPTVAWFRTWLARIRSHRGTAVECAPLTDRDVLVALYDAGGPGWTNSAGWLTEAPLGDWHGVDVDAQGRVRSLNLSDNGLTGTIPAELGTLANLQSLSLSFNDLAGSIPPELEHLVNLQLLDLDGNYLSGPIPPELVDLANLARLNLYWNDLSGAIPPELGQLVNLQELYLGRNGLSGAVPPELGNLANLQSLSLDWNDLSGAIPPELGTLANLQRLHFEGNGLTGAIPPTFGGLAHLIELDLSYNAGLAGAIPAALRNLNLESLFAAGTDLCVPRERMFEEWLVAISKRRIALCGDPPAAYLVQAVQSRAHPVPLVAGEDALLRVFVTAAMETTEGIPEVRARFYLNGSERHVVDIAGSSVPIPTEIDEGELSKSVNAEIPGRMVQPGLEMVVEIDPGGVLDPELGVPERIPEEGRLAIEVREMPTLDLTVIPFLLSSDPDSAIIGLVDGMATDPEGHALLETTHVLLPVAHVDVTAHAPVASTSNSVFDLLAQTQAIRVLEGGRGHYMGTISGNETGGGSIQGLALRPGRASFSVPNAGVIAHELGHNMSLGHAPCGGADWPDPSFPDPTGAIGAWGYDFPGARLVPKTRKDHMSYCDPGWTSDYHFTNALGHRLLDEGASATALAAGPLRSLLLWGGVDTTNTPFLNPAFVADAPPALPDSAGDYSVTGRDASGRELFSLSFAMPVALSEDGEISSFVFALPTRPGWAGTLATVTLSGPDGTATLDSGSDMPMAILRDPATGRVRGFLRGADDPAAIQAAADAPAGGRAGMNVLFSRGIPSGTAWRN